MEIVYLIVNLAVIFLLAFILIYWFLAPLISAPFWPSTAMDIIKMFELADLNEKDVFVDLGSGDGRVVLAASRVCKKAVGIEYNPFLTLFARGMEFISANGEVEFKHKSYWREDLKDYDVVMLYLNSNAVSALTSKLQSELKKGGRVVTKNNPLPGWKPEKVLEDKYFLYVKK
jgi:protein-L-isoaspartate O-methyltransferase